MMTVTVTSCKKTETVPNAINIEEGYLSTTNNADQMKDIDLSDVETPVFQQSFSGDLTEEAADAEWKKAVKEYMETLPNVEDIEDRSTNSFYTLLKTYTGAVTNAETNGTVYAATIFDSNLGIISSKWLKLDHSDADRRRGTWDFYMIKNTFDSQIDWVQLHSANIALRGTDAWYLKHYDTLLLPEYQTVSSTGSSGIGSNPSVWLDSELPTSYDFYYTGKTGNGRLNF